MVSIKELSLKERPGVREMLDTKAGLENRLVPKERLRELGAFERWDAKNVPRAGDGLVLSAGAYRLLERGKESSVLKDVNFNLGIFKPKTFAEALEDQAAELAPEALKILATVKGGPLGIFAAACDVIETGARYLSERGTGEEAENVADSMLFSEADEKGVRSIDLNKVFSKEERERLSKFSREEGIKNLIDEIKKYPSLLCRNAPEGGERDTLEFIPLHVDPIEMSIRIGRHPGDAYVTDQTVSRHHAKFGYDAKVGSYYIMDNNSTAGTEVNGELLPPGEGRYLKGGEYIKLGRMQFIFMPPMEPITLCHNAATQLNRADILNDKRISADSAVKYLVEGGLVKRFDPEVKRQDINPLRKDFDPLKAIAEWTATAPRLGGRLNGRGEVSPIMDLRRLKPRSDGERVSKSVGAEEKKPDKKSWLQRAAGNISKFFKAIKGPKLPPGIPPMDEGIPDEKDISPLLPTYLSPFVRAMHMDDLVNEKDLEGATTVAAELQRMNGALKPNGDTGRVLYDEYAGGEKGAMEANLIRKGRAVEVGGQTWWLNYKDLKFKNLELGWLWDSSTAWSAFYHLPEEEKISKGMGRFYVSVMPEHAADIWNEVGKVVEYFDDRDWPILAKIAAETNDLLRGDSVVIYFCAENQKAAYEQVTSFMKAHPEWFKYLMPVFTARVLDEYGSPVVGLSFGQEPQRGYRESFGGVRSRAMKTAIDEIRAYIDAGMQVTRENMMMIMARALEKSQVDIKYPAFNRSEARKRGIELFDHIFSHTNQERGRPGDAGEPTVVMDFEK